MVLNVSYSVLHFMDIKCVGLVEYCFKKLKNKLIYLVFKKVNYFSMLHLRNCQFISSACDLNKT